MKQSIFIGISCFFFFLSCSKDINVLEDLTTRDGGYIEFKNMPTLNISTKNLPESTFIEPLIDNNKSAISYKITVFFNGNVAEDFIVINSFPQDLTFKFQELADALGVPITDFDTTAEIRFLGTVTTILGDYNGEDANFGGNTRARLLNNPKQALRFSMKFFTPPPYHLRKTSFEEPEAFGVGVNYIKEGIPGDSEDLKNHPGQPIVDYVSKGTSRDDEIGFNSEIFYSSSVGVGFEAEQIGVTNQLVDFASYPDGVQGFRIEDVDNDFRMTFDKVDIPVGNPKTGVQIKIFFKPTTWENTDYVNIYAIVEDDSGSRRLDIFSIRGENGGLDAIDAIEGEWQTIDTGLLDNIKSYQVIIDANVSRDEEEVTWDNLLIYIPDPE